jgi:hypothetical protein
MARIADEKIIPSGETNPAKEEMNAKLDNRD